MKDLLVTTGLTPVELLKVQALKIEREKHGNYILIIELRDNKIQNYRIEELMARRLSELESQLKCKEPEVFAYFKEALKEADRYAPPSLLATPIDKKTLEEQKIICKHLLSYHPEGPLKSLLATHPLFFSQRIHQCPSLLFPEIFLTREEPKVYLLAKNKGLGDEHAMICMGNIKRLWARVSKLLI